MPKMFYLPDWLLRAVLDAKAPLEVLLDPVSLSSIVSPREVGIYLARMDVVSESTPQALEDVVKSFSPLHWSYYDYLQDAAKKAAVCPERTARLNQIVEGYHEYRESMRSTAQATQVNSDGTVAQAEGESREAQRAACQSMWLQGNPLLPATSDPWPSVYQVTVTPVLIRSTDVLRCTGLDQDHLDDGPHANRVIVYGIGVSPDNTGNTQRTALRKSCSDIMTVLNKYMSAQEVLRLGLTTTYIETLLTRH